MATRLRAASITAVMLCTLPAAAGPHGAQPQCQVAGTCESGLFNVGGAEIPACDPHRPSRVASLDVVADLAPRCVGAANSVDTRFGVLAANEGSGTTTVYEIR